MWPWKIIIRYFIFVELNANKRTSTFSLKEINLRDSKQLFDEDDDVCDDAYDEVDDAAADVVAVAVAVDIDFVVV